MTTGRSKRRGPAPHAPLAWKRLLAVFVFTTVVGVLANLIVSGDPEPAFSLLAGWGVTAGTWAGARLRRRSR